MTSMTERATGLAKWRNLDVEGWAAVGQRYGIFAILAVVAVAAALTVDGFASIGNASSILRSVSLVGIVAVGMTLIVISGHFVDLSVPSQVAVSALIMLTLADESLLLAIGLALLAAGTIGLGNGVLIGIFRGNPVVVTLGIQTVAAGLILIATNGSYVYGTSDSLDAFGSSGLGPLPIQALFFLSTLVVAQIVVTRTRYGFQLLAIGANRHVAAASGVPIARLIVATFFAAAVLSGLAGVFLAAFANSVNSTAGTGYEFDALTAVVIGGTSLFGGIGSLWRTLTGVLFIGVLNNVMVLAGLPFEAQLLVKGAVIIAAVALDALAQSHGELA